MIIITNTIAPTVAPMIKAMLFCLPFDKDEELPQVALLGMHKKLLPSYLHIQKFPLAHSFLLSLQLNYRKMCHNTNLCIVRLAYWYIMTSRHVKLY